MRFKWRCPGSDPWTDRTAEMVDYEISETAPIAVVALESFGRTMLCPCKVVQVGDDFSKNAAEGDLVSLSMMTVEAMAEVVLLVATLSTRLAKTK